MQYIVNPSNLAGSIWIPPSKSHTMRAIFFASFAEGQSIIRHYLASPDTQAMIHACRLLGAKITIDNDKLEIIGTAGKSQAPDNIIDAGNSGQVLRFIAAIAGLNSAYTVITGDESIRNKRPIQPLLNALTQLGAFAVSTKSNGYAPIIIKGPLSPGFAELEGQDSQPVSALLMASAFLPGKTQIKVLNPGEKPWVQLTLSWFDRLGIGYTCNDYVDYIINGNAKYAGFNYDVPGDFSSAAFPLVAALITGSEITIENIDMHDAQGDKALIPALQQMGAIIEYDAKKKLLHVKKGSELTGGVININDYIDAITILGVVGCFTHDSLQVTGAEIAKHKESDRPAMIAQELQKMRGNTTLTTDGLLVRPSALVGNTVLSHHDHRMAMSLAVAGLAASGTTIIEGVECVAKSFPNFAQAMQGLGADIQEKK